MAVKEESQIRWDDIPPILNSAAVLDKAFKRASRAQRRGRNKVERDKSESIGKIQALGGSISSTLESYVKAFPSLDRLPAFFRDLVDILADKEDLKHHLGAIEWCKGRVVDFTKAYSREIGRLGEVRFIELRRKEAYGRISSVVRQISSNLEALEIARIRLARIPYIDPETPIIVVAGAANVGKSQFVAAVSSAKPKVARYPFTTKEVSVGYLLRHRIRLQVIDTPGLLDRPAENRNPIEQQAANALRHLARVVIFLIDPTETCGFTMSEQLHLLLTLREEFPQTEFIEVENKVDVMNTGSKRPKISALTGKGVDRLLDRVVEALTSHVPEASPPRKAG